MGSSLAKVESVWLLGTLNLEILEAILPMSAQVMAKQAKNEARATKDAEGEKLDKAWRPTGSLTTDEAIALARKQNQYLRASTGKRKALQP